jgi:hypothetical protein
MRYPSKALVESVRARFSPGTRVCLPNGADDRYSPLPAGLCGTVVYVDDICNIDVNWDNGSKLNAIYGHDSIVIINKSE